MQRLPVLPTEFRFPMFHNLFPQGDGDVGQLAALLVFVQELAALVEVELEALADAVPAVRQGAGGTAGTTGNGGAGPGSGSVGATARAGAARNQRRAWRPISSNQARSSSSTPA